MNGNVVVWGKADRGLLAQRWLGLGGPLRLLHLGFQQPSLSATLSSPHALLYLPHQTALRDDNAEPARSLGFSHIAPEVWLCIVVPQAGCPLMP